MKNKKLAICLIIFASLVTIIILGSAIFALNTVSINFLDETNILTGKEQQIVESGKFTYGSNVLFTSKKQFIQNIEKANPYIKIINIETIFPNSYSINCVERIEIFAVKEKDNKYLILDEDFKVLKKLDNFNNNENNAILLMGLENVENYSEGDFFNINSRQKVLINQTFKSFRQWDLSYSSLKSKISTVELDFEKANTVSVKMHSGTLINVINADVFNSEKFNLAFSTYDSDITLQTDYIFEVRHTSENKIKLFYEKV